MARGLTSAAGKTAEQGGSGLRNLSREDRAAYEQRLLERRKRAKADSPGKIEPRNHAGRCALSFAQQRLWFLDKFEPDSALYNIPMVVRLRGALNVPVLEEAFNALVRRHETLRTVCDDAGGKGSQVVLPELRIRIVIDDVDEGEVLQRVARESVQPFDLKCGPLIRVGLLRVGARDHVLIVVMHHIVSDGWSMGIITRELSALYRNGIHPPGTPLSPLAVQYADYSEWQRKRLEGPELDRQLGYWRDRLADAPVLELPTDHPRPPAQSYRGASHHFTIDRNLVRGLKALGHEQRATLFMTLLAAFQVLLSRHSGQTDVVVGSPIAGRTQQSLEGLVGFFINSLALRTDLSGDPPFLVLLDRVREVALGAYAHQDLPFEKLVEEVRPQRDPSRNPLFQVMFALQNVPRDELELAGVVIEPVELTWRTAKFDLTLTLVERNGELLGTLNYARDLFEPETVERFVGHYRTLLDGIVAAPDTVLSELSVLTEAEEHRILHSWNATGTDYPRDEGLVEGFQRWVRASPEAVAIEAGGQSLTYEALNRRANRLAHHILSLDGVTRDRVGLCLQQSPDLVVAMLAILKAGGAYVPLDLAYPADRLNFMVRDSGVEVVIADRATASVFADADVTTVLLETVAVGSEGSGENPQRLPGAEDSAYVIYTSGSTGQPKGVAVPHRGVVRLVLNTDYVQLHPHDRIAQISNSSFDAATFEVWGALLNGASLIMIPKDVVLSPRQFASELERRRVTTLFVTTALFNATARECPSAFSGLNHLLFGGEAVDPRWVRVVLKAGPPRRLVHVYGPTESTTFATWFPVTSVADDDSTIPIGRPVANTRAYVLDHCGHPVPVGVEGELYLAGDGVALGYVNRAQLTAERFLEEPWRGPGGGRMYRTGDRVCRLATGDLEFRGRTDHQIKLNGFRIEPGEIEAVLRQHPDVTEAVVVPHGRDGAVTRVVGYVRNRAGHRADTTSIDTFLRGRLPGYMIPAALVALDEFPRTPNGKTDREALPELGVTERSEGDVLCPLEWPPQNAIEVVLRRIWADVLQVSRVGPRDNFFDLGGHSIAAIQMLADVERELGLRISVSQLFEKPTVRELANLVFQGEPWSTESDLVPIQPGGDATPLFCVYGDAFYLARELGEDQPLYWFTPWPKRLALRKSPRELTFQSIEDTARDYVAEVLHIQPEGPYRLAGHCAGAMIVYEMAQQLRESGRDVALLALMDAPGTNVRPQKVKKVQAAAQDLRAATGLTAKMGVAWRRTLRSLQGRLKLRAVVRRYAVRRHLRTGEPMPIELTRVYTNELIGKAMKRYNYRPYAGRVVLFRSEAFVSEEEDVGHIPERWRTLIAGELHSYVVRGAGHNDLFADPHINFLAERLKQHLRA